MWSYHALRIKPLDNNDLIKINLHIVPKMSTPHIFVHAKPYFLPLSVGFTFSWYFAHDEQNLSKKSKSLKIR